MNATQRQLIKLTKYDQDTPKLARQLQTWLKSYNGQLKHHISDPHATDDYNYLEIFAPPHVIGQAIANAQALGFEIAREELTEDEERRIRYGLDSNAQAAAEDDASDNDYIVHQFERVADVLTNEQISAIDAIIDPMINEIDKLRSEGTITRQPFPDFICSSCNGSFYYPHEGSFLGQNEPDILCVDCYSAEQVEA